MTTVFNGPFSLLGVHTKLVSVHVGVKSFWVWGRQTEPYELCAEYFGCGPLFLVVWDPPEVSDHG